MRMVFDGKARRETTPTETIAFSITTAIVSEKPQGKESIGPIRK
ncbi:unnamed protein product [Haemonchus placei]|uniref:Transposase n=1 Tax=Haemonchus placei TaxID=6290 RepID=A0A0N4W4K4_HAEPC|nr:unnamed protein product [Haemonchus placei]